MEKHKNIPAAATWNEEEKQWELAGPKNAAGQRTGIWEDWHIDGHRCGVVDFGDGTPPYPIKRYHADGTLAQEGFGLLGDTNHWRGTFRWNKSEHPTTESFPTIAKDIDAIWSAEYDYTETEAVYSAQRYYNKANEPVTMWGDPQPERAASVPARAHYVKALSSANGVPGWIVGQVNGLTGKFVGDYAEWDMGGVLTTKRVYSNTGELVEYHEYTNGRLWMSKIYTDPKHYTSSFYHRDIEPPVIRSSTSHRNGTQDRTETFFDTNGNQLYSVRMEKLIDKIHERRYYNDTLVYQGLASQDKTQKPSTYSYYRENGSVLIDYTSNGDDTGVWHLYDEAGQEVLTLPQYEEADMEEYEHGDTFMPTWRDYNYENTVTDWQAVEENFKSAYKDTLIEEKIASLPIPDYLQTELDKVNWSEVEHAMYSSDGLPRAINGYLSDDADVALKCLGKIWMEIEHQGSVYECTYEVSIIFARMLPHYASHADIQSRLFDFLYDVLSLHYIKSHTRYADLVAALESSLPVIGQLATHVNDAIALKSQFILLEVGHKAQEAENFFIQEWRNVNNPKLRRAYAAFALGHLYVYTKQSKKLISTYGAAFPDEKEPLVRLILAIRLVAGAGKKAKDEWLSELIPVLSNPDSVDSDFYEIQPFIGGTEADEYALMILEYAKREVLEKNIEPIIDILPDSDIFKQESLLRAIFAILFKADDALSNITPMRKKALLAAAEVAAQHVGWINHSEIFREYDLPHDAYELRQLAEQV
jgi:antitoxin component YwqK of YwqJK toxin-antitoxin module